MATIVLRMPGPSQEQVGEGEEEVHRAHDEAVDPATEVAGQRAEEAAQRQAQRDRGERDGQRGAGAVDDARQDVAAELVRAEQVLGVRRRAAGAQVLVRRVLGGELRREDRHDDQEQHDDGADHAQAVAPEAAPDVAAGAGGGRHGGRGDAHW